MTKITHAVMREPVGSTSKLSFILDNGFFGYVLLHSAEAQTLVLNGVNGGSVRNGTKNWIKAKSIVLKYLSISNQGVTA